MKCGSDSAFQPGWILKKFVLNHRTIIAFEEIERDMQEWKQLINDNKKLKEEYKSLVAEMRAMKETAIKATFGNKLRYKIAR